MARQTGVVRMRGKLNGISFYRMDGKDVVRMSYGPSSEKIMNDPHYAQTKANTVLFGGANQMATLFRRVFAKAIRNGSYGRVQGKLVKLFLEMMRKDKPGTQPVHCALSQNKEMLKGFALGIDTSLASALVRCTLAKQETDRITVQLNFQLLKKHVKVPAGTKCIQVVHHAGMLSDLVYHAGTSRYTALNETGCVGFAKSEALPVKTVKNIETIIDPNVQQSIPGTACVVLVTEVVFYNRAGEALEAGRGLCVTAIF